MQFPKESQSIYGLDPGFKNFAFEACENIHSPHRSSLQSFSSYQVRSVCSCLLLLTFDGHISANKFVDTMVGGVNITIMNKSMRRIAL